MNILKNLIVISENIKDPRIDRRKLHKLTDMIALAVYGLLAGANDFEEIEYICKERIDFLKQCLELKNGIPSHDTFERVFSRINPLQLSTALAAWANSLLNETQRQIAIDGKTLRHSFDKAANKSALHIIEAYSTSSGITLAQIQVESKTNEITAIPKILQMLECEGDIISIDAIGCQKNIAEAIVQKKADYILAVKGNQKTLFEDIQCLLNSDNKHVLKNINISTYKTDEKSHGRYETRSCVCMDATTLPIAQEWCNIKSVAKITSIRRDNLQQTSETRYFISSLPVDAKKIALAVRKHWTIENALHWVLDVVFNEDNSRIRKDSAPENFAALRRAALAFIQQRKPKNTSIKKTRFRALVSQSFANQLFTGILMR